MTETLASDSTHLVVDSHEMTSETMEPLKLMQAVCSNLGGLKTLRLLRQLLFAGKLKLVAARSFLFSLHLQ